MKFWNLVPELDRDITIPFEVDQWPHLRDLTSAVILPGRIFWEASELGVRRISSLRWTPCFLQVSYVTDLNIWLDRVGGAYLLAFPARLLTMSSTESTTSLHRGGSPCFRYVVKPHSSWLP